MSHVRLKVCNHQVVSCLVIIRKQGQLLLDLHCSQCVEMVAIIDSDLSSHVIAVISLDIFQPAEGSAGPELIINLCF